MRFIIQQAFHKKAYLHFYYLYVCFKGTVLEFLDIII